MADIEIQEIADLQKQTATQIDDTYHVPLLKIPVGYESNPIGNPPESYLATIQTIADEVASRIDVGGPGGTSYTFTPPLTNSSNTVSIAPSSGTSAGSMSAANFTKLAGIEVGATANATDVQLRDRTTHTGEQAISTVTGLQAALDGKTNTGHTHTTANITGFAEAVDDRVAALLVPGSNVTLSYDDTANTLTVNAASGITTADAQLAVGSILVDSSKIDFTYSSVTPSITASIVPASIVNADISSSANIAQSKISGLTTSLAGKEDVGVAASLVSGITTASIGAQPLNSNLTSLASLAGQTAFGRALLTLADQAALLAAAGAQAASTFLSSLTLLSTNGIIERTSATTSAIISISSTIRSFLGASDQSGARTALGLGSAATSSTSDFATASHTQTASTITDFNSAVDARLTGLQPLDSDLTAIAALATTTYGRSLLTLADQAALLSTTGAQPLDSDLTSIAALTTTTFGRSLLTLADAATALTTLGAQPLDSDLTAIAALTTTATGRSLLAIADGAAGRTILGSQQALSTVTAGVTFNDQTVSRYGMPTRTESSTTYALQASDNGLAIYFTAATAITVTVPNGLPTGFSVTLIQDNTGQVFVDDPTSAAVIVQADNQFRTAKQNAAISLLPTPTANKYTLVGYTAA